MKVDMQRFVDAQNSVYPAVCAELAAGRKRTRRMWFIFPQLRALGRSAMAQHFGIASIAEASGYLQHAVLGARLLECTALVLGTRDRSAHEIFSTPDDMKFRSCMTLFAAADSAEPLFTQALDRFYGGRPDEATLAILRAPRD